MKLIGGYSRLMLRVILAAVTVALVLTIYLAISTTKYMLDAEGEVYSMRIVPPLVQTYVESHNGSWPQSWEDLEKTPQSRIWVDQAPIDFDLVRQKVVVDFRARPADLANQTTETFSAIRPVEAVYDYSHDPGIERLLKTLRRFHLHTSKDKKPAITAGRQNSVSTRNHLVGPLTKEPRTCICGALEEWAEDPSLPVEWNTIGQNMYGLWCTIDKTYALAIWFCPACGGFAPHTPRPMS